ncbi:MAG: proton-conducting transporter membrane subunit, partial [Alphaproteobacteria bacterium]|nr:proton-conducting transporter membrane subunit [Alphaproteobacteria bacterium]
MNFNYFIFSNILGIIFLNIFILFLIFSLIKSNFIKRHAGILSILVNFINIVLFILPFFNILQEDVLNNSYHSLQPYQNFNAVYNFEWLKITHDFTLNFGVQIDNLSILMVFLIIFISFLIQIYSINYMKGEPRYSQFFGYLNFFTLAMLILVVSSNIIQLFICWEWVGLASYLLINFYFQKPSANLASRKSFLITRFTDIAFLIGIFILIYYTKFTDIEDIKLVLLNSNSIAIKQITIDKFLSLDLLSLALFGIMIGALGKSAMFPFHSWLPDAMEGPTPASALIHSATMVVAGVFLIMRFYEVYLLKIDVLEVLKYIGFISAFIGGIYACFQTEVKKILAYSTISQIGIMYISLSLYNNSINPNLPYSNAIFHLFNHAFFKSGLFLCAGIIIHFTHSNFVNKSKNLAVIVPFLCICYVLLLLSLMGIPLFNGYFSKELIYFNGHLISPQLGNLISILGVLTIIYSLRMLFLIFYSNSNNELVLQDADNKFDIKYIPIFILVIISLFSGYVPINRMIHIKGISNSYVLNHQGFDFFHFGINMITIFIIYMIFKTTMGSQLKLFLSNILS